MRDPTAVGGGVLQVTELMLAYHCGAFVGFAAKAETTSGGRAIVVSTSTSTGMARSSRTRWSSGGGGGDGVASGEGHESLQRRGVGARADLVGEGAPLAPGRNDRVGQGLDVGDDLVGDHELLSAGPGEVPAVEEE